MFEAAPSISHIRPLDPLPAQGEFLLITRIDRLRGSEYFIDSSPDLRRRLPPRIPAGGPGYASEEAALAAALDLARREAVPSILIQNRTVRGRPDWPAW